MKGLFSLDAIIAMLLVLFLVLWSQGFVSMSFDNANSFGISYEAKAEAIRVGSIMNTFFATAPQSGDYYSLSSDVARVFKNSSAFIISKTKGSSLNVSVQSRFTNSTSYYAAANVSYVSGRVTV